ncbi:hypothetical protein M407DRAFT_244238 [Tulasnella calospora MUT 4182]|uniref:Uncharacterized protein n=1 Tax=Tulasnella calospora MUT 4182 TaxID=1051891 RepID=A0A0C3Q3V2_9AGAM|nr:hypothetical protein M407DRAFT_246763 [Tulasnella calospora MUT 4182]KIO25030.1 hypothetical protein M407DRAFT_244238 [Tulasnella calospora MUT 4182]
MNLLPFGEVEHLSQGIRFGIASSENYHQSQPYPSELGHASDNISSSQRKRDRISSLLQIQRFHVVGGKSQHPNVVLMLRWWGRRRCWGGAVEM